MNDLVIRLLYRWCFWEDFKSIHRERAWSRFSKRINLISRTMILLSSWWYNELSKTRTRTQTINILILSSEDTLSIYCSRLFWIISTNFKFLDQKLYYHIFDFSFSSAHQQNFLWSMMHQNSASFGLFLGTSTLYGVYSTVVMCYV